MLESIYKDRLMKDIKFGLPYIGFRLENRAGAGNPDIVVTGNKVTSWWEGKVARPEFADTGLQQLTMRRLAREGYAYYIIWDEGLSETRIVEPKDRDHWNIRGISWAGFNNNPILDFMAKVHNR